MQSKRKEKSNSNTLKAWGKSSSLHGVPKIFNENYLTMKIFWAGCFLLSSCICTYLLIVGFLNYLSYSVSTSIKIVQEVPQDFPAVTICNSNGFINQKGYSKIKAIYDKLLFSGINASSSNETTTVDSTSGLLGYFDQIAKTLLYLNHNSTERIDFSLTLKEMLISCYFGYHKCDVEDFEYFYDIYMGNCYRFNGLRDHVRQVQNSGATNGLRIEMFVGQNNDSDFYSTVYGLFVAVHNQTTRPLLPNDGLNVPAGHCNDLMLVRTFYQKLSTPSNFCLDDSSTETPGSFDSDYFQYTFNYSAKYNQLICFKICIQALFVDKCKCYSVDYPSLGVSGEPCREAGINCTRTVLSESVDSHFIARNCLPYCPIECNRVEYTYTLSGNKYPSNGYSKFLYYNSSFPFGDVGLSSMKDSILQLRINYDSLNYHVISETLSQSFLVFLSNTGGTLGLFIGCSVLSLMEVFEPLFLYLSKLYYQARLGNSKK